MFNASINKVSSSSVKAMQSIQESSNEVLDFKSRRLASIEVYEIQFFRVDFNLVRGYMFGLSFLTILNIYKDYFEGRKR